MHGLLNFLDDFENRLDLGRRTVLKKFRKLAFIDVVHLVDIRAEKDVSGKLQ